MSLLDGIAEIAGTLEQAEPQRPGVAQKPRLDERKAVPGLASAQLEARLDNLALSQKVAGGIGAGEEGAVQAADSSSDLDLVAIRLFTLYDDVYFALARSGSDLRIFRDL